MPRSDPQPDPAPCRGRAQIGEPLTAPHRPRQMQSSRALWSILASLLALAAAPARATDSHDYAKDEYAIIRDGLAPDKRVSLASHADPEAEGYGQGHNFHVWLMAEPAHRKIAPLDDIGSSNNLDTGPHAYRALWSADSRRVAVSFRSDRHALELNLYNIESRRAHLILVPVCSKT